MKNFAIVMFAIIVGVANAILIFIDRSIIAAVNSNNMKKILSANVIVRFKETGIFHNILPALTKFQNENVRKSAYGLAIVLVLFSLRPGQFEDLPAERKELVIKQGYNLIANQRFSHSKMSYFPSYRDDGKGGLERRCETTGRSSATITFNEDGTRWIRRYDDGSGSSGTIKISHANKANPGTFYLLEAYLDESSQKNKNFPDSFYETSGKWVLGDTGISSDCTTVTVQWMPTLK